MLVADSEFWVRSNNDKFCEWWFPGKWKTSQIMQSFWESDSGETENCVPLLVIAMLLFFLTTVIARLFIFKETIQ